MTDVLDILNTLIHDDHHWLGRVGRRERFEKGAVLIHEGEPNDTLFFILSGVVAIHVAGVGEIARVANAEIVGEISLLEGTRPVATVTAMEPTNVLRIGRRRLQAKLDDDAEFASRFYRAVALLLSLRLRRTIEALKTRQT
jgi:CRP/FNR family transcriptional regulator, cyclic AMP receptor protein